MKKSKVDIEKVEKEAVESQFTMLKNEKVALNKFLEEAKAVQNEDVAMAASLKFEQERLIRVAKAKVEQKLAYALSEKE